MSISRQIIKRSYYRQTIPPKTINLLRENVKNYESSLFNSNLELMEKLKFDEYQKVRDFIEETKNKKMDNSEKIVKNPENVIEAGKAALFSGGVYFTGIEMINSGFSCNSLALITFGFTSTSVSLFFCCYGLYTLYNTFSHSETLHKLQELEKMRNCLNDKWEKTYAHKHME